MSEKIEHVHGVCADKIISPSVNRQNRNDGEIFLTLKSYKCNIKKQGRKADRF